MNKKQVAKVLREHALYHENATIFALPLVGGDDAFNALDDFGGLAWPESFATETEKRMFLLFVAESLE